MSNLSRTTLTMAGVVPLRVAPTLIGEGNRLGGRQVGSRLFSANTRGSLVSLGAPGSPHDVVLTFLPLLQGALS